MTDPVRAELKWWDALLAIAGLLVIIAASLIGLAMNVVNFLLMLYVPVAVGTRIHGAIKGRLTVRVLRHRWLLVQAGVRVAFVVLWLAVLRLTVPWLMLGDQANAIWLIFLPTLGITALAGIIAKKRVLVARVLFLGVLTLLFGVQLVMMFLPASDVVHMPSPLKGDVLVVQGGASPLVNHHFIHRSQKNALDIVVLRKGKVVDGEPKDRSSYGCFGADLHAPLKGTIAKVVSDRRDMNIGETDSEQIVGNHVVLQIAPERFVLFAHMKQRSTTVKIGDEVEAGQVIGQCGNSGNTSAPHLHLQVQNRIDLFAPDLQTFPIVFEGDSRPPRRNDRWTF